jgi:hypothetical protein
MRGNKRDKTERAKKRARIEIQPVINPISYEKPIYQTVSESLSLHPAKKNWPR